MPLKSLIPRLILYYLMHIVPTNEFIQHLLEQGISIRKLGKIGNHEGCLRVTIGTKEMNSKFLLAIRDLLG